MGARLGKGGFGLFGNPFASRYGSPLGLPFGANPRMPGFGAQNFINSRQDFQDYLNAYKTESQAYNTEYANETKRIQGLAPGAEKEQAYRDLIRYGPTSYRQPATPATPATPTVPVRSAYDVAYENEVKRRAELDKLMQGTSTQMMP